MFLLRLATSSGTGRAFLPAPHPCPLRCASKIKMKLYLGRVARKPHRAGAELSLSSHTKFPTTGRGDGSWFIFVIYSSSGLRDESTCALSCAGCNSRSSQRAARGLPLLRTYVTQPGECWARAWWERVCSYTDRRKYIWILAQELKWGKSLGRNPEQWFLCDKNGSRWQRVRNWSHYPEGRETRIERWKVFISVLFISNWKVCSGAWPAQVPGLFGGVLKAAAWSVALVPDCQEAGLGCWETICAGEENNALKSFSVRQLMTMYTHK